MSAAQPRTISVLLVEDSPADGRLLIEALKPAIAAGDVLVQTVKRLSLAIEALKGFDFSCVLLDLGLPDGFGVDNVRTLREVDRKTAIIVLTGLADEKLAAEALGYGAQDYLVKGENDGEQLLKQLRRAVQRNRQTWLLETRRDKAFFEAGHDALTLLPNAALFADRARQQLAGARVSELPFALGYFAISGLEALRKRHGDLLADDVLKTLSERWSEGLQTGDTLARIGGNEFALCRQPAGSAADWQAVIEDCRRALANLHTASRSEMELVLSAGVAYADKPGQGVDELLSAARGAVAEAHATTTPPLSTMASTVTAMATHWQPWVDVSTLRCVGFELLADADTPDLPASSAEHAARTLAAAAQLVHQAQAWSASRFQPGLLAFDIPALALESEGFAARLVETLGRADIPAASVQLEIGEAAFRRLPQHATVLTRLRKQGFRLALDGDGSHDISLHDFAACALDAYKLSPGLVRVLMDESLHGNARRLVSAILGASQQLGAIVIATGVDSEGAADALRLIGVRYLQGRALLPPLAAQSVPLAWERPVLLRRN